MKLCFKLRKCVNVRVAFATILQYYCDCHNNNTSLLRLYFRFLHIQRNCIYVVISSICLRYDYFWLSCVYVMNTKTRSLTHTTYTHTQHINYSISYEFINSVASVIVYSPFFMHACSLYWIRRLRCKWGS